MNYNNSKTIINKEYEIFKFGDMKIKTDKKNNINKNAVLPIFKNSGTYFLMNYIINNKLEIKNKKALDVFAGSGALGLTALKAGAKHVDLLDINPKAIKYMKENAKLNKFDSSKYNIIKGDIKKFKTNKKYDLLFANPPFVPVPKCINASIHSNGGIDGNYLTKILIKKINKLLKPNGKAFFYLLQITSNNKPIIIKELKKHIKNRNIKLFKTYNKSVDFDVFVKEYISKQPVKEKQINKWYEKLQKEHGKNLGLNSYIIHITQKNKNQQKIIIKKLSKKYNKLFFQEKNKNIDVKKKFLAFIGNY